MTSCCHISAMTRCRSMRHHPTTPCGARPGRPRQAARVQLAASQKGAARALGSVVQKALGAVRIEHVPLRVQLYSAALSRASTARYGGNLAVGFPCHDMPLLAGFVGLRAHQPNNWTSRLASDWPQWHSPAETYGSSAIRGGPTPALYYDPAFASKAFSSCSDCIRTRACSARSCGRKGVPMMKQHGKPRDGRRRLNAPVSQVGEPFEQALKPRRGMRRRASRRRS